MFYRFCGLNRFSTYTILTYNNVMKKEMHGNQDTSVQYTMEKRASSANCAGKTGCQPVEE